MSVGDPGSEQVKPAEFDGLRRYLLDQAQHCLRPPADRFRQKWLAPMPLSDMGRAFLESRTKHRDVARTGVDPTDGFKTGDYSLGLFHHDASEAAIELLRHEPFRESCAGSLLCLLDGATADGCVHRVELPHKTRDPEPSKPIIAQYALRVLEALGAAFIEEHRVLPRVREFIRYLERNYQGLHGLFLTHSSLQSGFDSDLLSASLPDRSVEGPDTNAFMVLEYRALAALCSELGEDGSEWDDKAAQLSERMEQLTWFEDERGGFYVALRWEHGAASLDREIVSMRDPSGQVRPIETWATLLPLYAGVPSPERAEKMMRRLVNQEGYWGPWGVRTTARDDVFFSQAPRVMLYDHKKLGRGPVSNWSGPVWVLSNYYLAEGLARYGHREKARELALKTARLLAQGLARDGALRESYDDQGRGLWPRQGTFISWNVLALSLLREFVPEAGIV